MGVFMKNIKFYFSFLLIYSKTPKKMTVKICKNQIHSKQEQERERLSDSALGKQKAKQTIKGPKEVNPQLLQDHRNPVITSTRGKHSTGKKMSYRCVDW